MNLASLQGRLTKLKSLATTLAVRSRIPQLLATGWTRTLTYIRRRRAPILAPYVNSRAGLRIVSRLLAPPVLALFCLVYGFYFALTAPFLMVAFATPVALLLLMSIWALPTSAKVPMRTAEFFFSAFIVGLVIWPNYLAFSFPGLPWITMIRLTAMPMALLLAVSLSMSPQVRSRIRELLDAVNPFWKLMLVFVVMGVITLPLSKYPGASFQKWLIQQVTWTGAFVMAAYVGRTQGRPSRYLTLFVLLILPLCYIAFLESEAKEVLWRYTIPNFLKIEDPAVLTMLGKHVRSATGTYRVKTVYGEALGPAEIFALASPFALHFVVFGRNILLRIGAYALLPLLFYCIRLTDSRLGVVGFLASFAAYFLGWSIYRFRTARGEIFPSIILYALPIIFAFFTIAVQTIQPLNVLVFGGGESNASNLARENQWRQALPSVVANPIGSSTAGAGAAMGGGGFVTIDNYYLAVAIDYGAIGLTAFWGMYILAIGYCMWFGTSKTVRKDPEILLLLPIGAALAEFLVIKSVYSQQYNHPMVHVMLGLMAALVWRAKVLGDARAKT